MSTNLAQKLREGTTKAHSMAENVGFVRSFLGGVVDKQSYCKLLGNLFFIYSAIEEEIEVNKTHKVVKSIYFPELYRKNSLIKDLNYYYGSNWSKLIQPSSATQIYVDRIHKISYNNPELLIAHSYTRYIGDLSGGQILKKIAKSAMQLPDNVGSSFYDFDLVKDEKLFKDQYRDSLNNIPLSSLQIEQIIAEANIAFNLNMKIFQELNSNLLKIMLMLFLSSVNSFYKKLT
uniref:Heme oxygenase n=1 Tax=Chondria tumulosa TaxID=2740715 RepID=A0A896ST27_9FLOR|nr:heme oxygenase [Chondria tumulosa]QSD57123.1 heme oxygenase [Chondria tumulosa]